MPLKTLIPSLIKLSYVLQTRRQGVPRGEAEANEEGQKVNKSVYRCCFLVVTVVGEVNPIVVLLVLIKIYTELKEWLRGILPDKYLL